MRKDGRPRGPLGGGPQPLAQAMAKEQIVAQDQGAALTVHEFRAHEKGIGQAARVCLLGVAEADAPPAAVAEQPAGTAADRAAC